ncbi:mediator of RNA polymerase II transcription subunit 13-like [Chlorella sorokiniana]|uniref:Mediator of RNA polymerase II transcription subunit 13 n=1 Tax=Chlorella sorokiniana TaxID=3076 RepID=A0A2P6TSN0_CHLSO|nr:mediator of RNA polymerase II transcription subunit 13-like [Chlorella sorokiniana]|eukprot:PRW57054.1 mediator of RNA polymerase II transcription subunit 13-like [Chlorella sorokiniana]
MEGNRAFELAAPSWGAGPPALAARPEISAPAGIYQAWPAAGAAALLRRAASPTPLAPPWWDRMLPSLSLPYPPLPPQRQVLLQAASSRTTTTDGVTAEPLPQPSVLVGYEDDWLEVPPQVLPLWQATPLAPFGGPKALLHCLVCPEPQLAQAQQLVKDVGSLFETCCLGSHAPASGAAAVHTFSLQHPAGGAGSEAAAAEWRQLPLATRYLAGLRQACEQLQRQLLLDPPAELQEGAGTSLEDGSEPALLVYLACPLEQPADQVAALLEAAACLAPCTFLGADAGDVASALCLDSPGNVQPQQQQQQLEPCAPQQPDRPAGATPAADNSRAPGGSPPPDEQEEEEGEVKGRAGAGGRPAAEQQRYHGAASVLHDRQQGDFRCLPVLQLQRPEGSSPSNIVLQLLTPQALADLTGTAAKCTAFAVYSKAQRQAGLPQDCHVSVVELRALPPARFAGPDPPSGCLLLMEQQEGMQQQQQQQQQQACIVWLPPGGSSGSLLPQEHDTVRQLEVGLVAHSQQLPSSSTDPLRSVAQQMHALAWLHAAFQGACLRTLVGGGQLAPADAHLPLHAALATQLQGLVEHACAALAGRL